MRLTRYFVLADPSEIPLIIAPLKVSQMNFPSFGLANTDACGSIASGMLNQGGCLLQLAEERVVFLACNDNLDAETANGGSHWYVTSLYKCTYELGAEMSRTPGYLSCSLA